MLNVRHPMYLGIGVMFLFAPLALGSYFALPVFALLIPIIVSACSMRKRFFAKNSPAIPNIASAPETGWFPLSGEICRTARLSHKPDHEDSSQQESENRADR